MKAFYEQAFWRVAKEIKADHNALKMMLPELFSVFPNKRLEADVVERRLPSECWHWPSYEQYLAQHNLKLDLTTMREELCRRIAMLAYSLKRRHQMLQNVDFRPYWQFNVLVYATTPKICAERDKKVYLYNDPIWGSCAPCDWPLCGCDIRAFGEKDIIERGLTIESSFNL